MDELLEKKTIPVILFDYFRELTLLASSLSNTYLVQFLLELPIR